MTPAAEFPFHLGFAAPAEASAELSVQGAVPQWLRGTLYRACAALSSTDAGWQARHWFDALCMLYRFEFHGSRVRFATRFLKSRQFASAQRGERWGHELRGRLRNPLAAMSDNTNLNICRVNGRYLAMNESHFQYEFDAETLETLGLHCYDDDLPESLVLGAHPLFDAGRQEHINVAVQYRYPCRIVVYRILRDSNRRHVVSSFPVLRPPWIHSFCITARHVIIVQHPFFFQPWKFGLLGADIIDSFGWAPREGTTFIVIDRATGERRLHQAEACLMIHAANAYDDGDDIVVDLLCYPDPRLLQEGLALSPRGHPQVAETPRLPEYRMSRPHRYRLRPQRERAENESPFAEECEFPILNEAAARAQRYRYLYAIGPDAGHTGPAYLNRLYKFDFETGRSTAWGRPDRYLSEVAFARRPGSTREDDGVLLVPTLDAHSERSALRMLDAASLEERAIVAVPGHLPFGLHGQFFTR